MFYPVLLNLSKNLVDKLMLLCFLFLIRLPLYIQLLNVNMFYLIYKLNTLSTKDLKLFNIVCKLVSNPTDFSLIYFWAQFITPHNMSYFWRVSKYPEIVISYFANNIWLFYLEKDNNIKTFAPLEAKFGNQLRGRKVHIQQCKRSIFNKFESINFYFILFY